MITNDSTDEEIAQFLKWVKENGAADATLAAQLAEVLANSGERLGRHNSRTADIASTGGPSSLSTLLCPLFLLAGGFIVPKLGVPGRPAGGIDVLAQLPNYKVLLDGHELGAVLDRCGYAHFLAADRYAPLDSRLFRLRQQNSAQAVPTLVAASLLAKKLAVRVDRAGLDIRVGRHGNFGGSWDEAEINAKMFIRTANLLGIHAYPVLTNGAHPYQPYIGRRESLVALSLIFDGTAPTWLSDHVQMCKTITLACVPSTARRAIAAITVTELRDLFESNLVAQGSSPEEFAAVARGARNTPYFDVAAVSDGFVNYSLNEIRASIVALQAEATSNSLFPDPAGVVLGRRPGDWVQTGDVIATLRLDSGATAAGGERIRQELTKTSNRPLTPVLQGVGLRE